MRMVSDAARVVKISFSFWLAFAGFLSMVLPEVAFAIYGFDVSPTIRWSVPTLLFVAVCVARLVDQNGGVAANAFKTCAVVLMVTAFVVIASVQAGVAGGRPIAGDALAAPTHHQIQEATLPLATPFIAQWEGFRACAYIPIKGDVPTIGYGSTRGVSLGDCITKSQGVALLDDEVREYMEEFNTRMPQEAWAHMNECRNASFTELAFNIGWTGAAKSTAVRRLANGDVEGARTAITWYRKAGGRVVMGLVNRRAKSVLLYDCDLSVLP